MLVAAHCGNCKTALNDCIFGLDIGLPILKSGLERVDI